MAISVNTVYQKVLALANKEQRGYITPQEFNLFADMAQKEIFEQYFYDLNQFAITPGVSEEYSDMVDNLNEKIAIFEAVTTAASSGSLTGDLYRLGTVYTSNSIVAEQVQQNELLYMEQSFLTKPTQKRPVYVRTGGFKISVSPTSDFNYTYVRMPSKPAWGYVVVNERAMYDSSNKTDFELHQSEESELVYKILMFAGISMQKQTLAQSAAGLNSAKVQQEKQ